VWADQPANSGRPYDDFLLEKFEHYQTQKQTAQQQQHAQAAFTRATEERASTFSQRYRDAVSADATLPARIDARLYDLKTVDACLQSGEPVTALNAVAQEIVESPNAVKILVHLSEHPDEMASLASMSPAAVIRAMARLEAKLDGPVAPQLKTISTAPPLTTTLGTRPSVPGDAIQSALKSGDFLSYREAANARELAKR
jgi:hypothetical protein